MLRKTVKDATTILSTPDSVEVSPEDFFNPTLLYVNVQHFEYGDFEDVDLPSDELTSRFFRNNGVLYLTNYTFDPIDLDQPIKVVAVYPDFTNVFVGHRKLCFAVHQLERECREESFYLKTVNTVLMRRDENDTFVETLNKKRKTKRYGNPQPVFPVDSRSNEIGLITIEGTTTASVLSNNSINLEDFTLSQRSPRSNHESSNISILSVRSDSDTSMNMNSDNDRNEEIRTTQIIHSTLLDRRESKKTEITVFRSRLQALVTETVIKTNDIIVPTNSVKSSKKFSNNDSTIKRMSDELKTNGNGQLSSFDPVTVIEQNGVFEVISGNRRVMAYKDMLINKIWVTKIDAEDRKKYSLINFFRCAKTLMSSVLNIVMNHDLRVAVVALIDNMQFHLSLRMARQVLQSYKRNPTETVKVLRSSWSSEEDIKNTLQTIKPSLLFLLEKKNVEESVAQSLVSKYSADDQFFNFVKSTDLRLVKKNQKECINNKFRQFKEKLSEESNSRDTLNIIVKNIFDSDFDVLVTSNIEVASKIIDTKLTVVVILLGSYLSKGPYYIMMLPDSLSMEDDCGRLITHCAMSLCVKKNGEVLGGTEVTEFLASHGVTNRTGFTLEQLKSLSRNLKSFYFDIGKIVREKLSMLLHYKQETYIVPKPSHHQRLLKLLNQQSGV